VSARGIICSPISSGLIFFWAFMIFYHDGIGDRNRLWLDKEKKDAGRLCSAV
jgi:hypothetical protein